MSESQRAPEKANPAEPRRPGSAAAESRRDHIQKQLDEALADSFPASDPVAIVTSHQEEDWDQPDSR